VRTLTPHAARAHFAWLLLLLCHPPLVRTGRGSIGAMGGLSLALALALATAAAARGDVWLKGTFHQHATQPLHKCLYAADDVDGSGAGEELHQQDDGGTDADVLLDAIEASGRGYHFVGLIGNEVPPKAPRKVHNLTWLLVTENQMAAMCTPDPESKHCKDPCDPKAPEGSGPWSATVPHVNNLHREYIQGVPGVWVQHPTTDPERDEMLEYMTSGQDYLRGMEVYNSWADQAWDAVVPRTDAEIDPLYPVYSSPNCTAWDPYHEDPERYPEGSCTRYWGMAPWDATLRALKRPVYGLADDDGFVYTGDSDEPVYSHGKHDVQSDGPAWFRFGVGYEMVAVARENASAADISAAIDKGRFYASTGVELEYDFSPAGNASSDPDTLRVSATEPVVWGVTGGSGSADPEAAPLSGFNVSMCTMTTGGSPDSGAVTGVSDCEEAGRSLAPQPSRHLVLDLKEVARRYANGSELFFVRVQAHVRTRYTIVDIDHATKHNWKLTVSPAAANASAEQMRKEFAEGANLRTTGQSRRPLLVESSSVVDHDQPGSSLLPSIRLVSHFSDGDDDITPDLTSLKGLEVGKDQLIAERWAWLQPIFRRQKQQQQQQRESNEGEEGVAAAMLEDPFG
jgi:hypothetical protein